MSEVCETPISFEFAAPKTEAAFSNLRRAYSRLSRFQHEFISVTYGAGGSTRDGTKNAVIALSNEGFTVAPHLSFGGDDEATIAGLLEDYQAADIKQLVALRGDRQSGQGSAKMVHAAELVEFVRARTGDWFTIHVAAYPEIHPESISVATEIEFFKQKVDAGADCAITQYFFNVDAYRQFRDECHKAGIIIPIVPGIMPITNLAGLKRFSSICGADLPRWLTKRLETLDGDEVAVKDFGCEVVTRLCEGLIEAGAPALHFYTLNQSKPSARILENLGY
jgi:methylenetetrahydrofolate reductase (NADPH)